MSFQQCAVLAAILSLTVVPEASAQGSANIATLSTFGVLGLGQGQTARLGTYNYGSGAGQFSCSADLTFHDPTGQVLKSDSVRLTAQGVASLELSRQELPGSSRVLFRAALKITTLPGTVTDPSMVPIDACAVISVLEIFDTDTGRTVAVITQPLPIRQITPSGPGAKARNNAPPRP